mmetsp:Transcript_89292/g.288626  ORF Transcript_89292/g.288626 Transcript_89292/m.288626 type:complete len:249 (-) Transcript_89292:2143-2889(-)
MARGLHLRASSRAETDPDAPKKFAHCAAQYPQNRPDGPQADADEQQGENHPSGLLREACPKGVLHATAGARGGRGLGHGAARERGQGTAHGVRWEGARLAQHPDAEGTVQGHGVQHVLRGVQGHRRVDGGRALRAPEQLSLVAPVGEQHVASSEEVQKWHACRVGHRYENRGQELRELGCNIERRILVQPQKLKLVFLLFRAFRPRKFFHQHPNDGCGARNHGIREHVREHRCTDNRVPTANGVAVLA